MDIMCRAYSKQLCEYRDQCGCMLEELGKALEYLQEMKERHQQVSLKTNTLHQACEQLVDEQVMLSACMYTVTCVCVHACMHVCACVHVCMRVYV